MKQMRVLVTGANGFIGKNLVLRLHELPEFSTVSFLRNDDAVGLPELLAGVDAVVHLAGENRPKDESAFGKVNAGLTRSLCSAIRSEHEKTRRKIKLIFASSTQAVFDNPYGRSKRAAEEAIEIFSSQTRCPVAIYRLPGVFGKWCKPSYNSVVATFCHNIARDLPIQISDPDALVRLVYVDDVVSAFINFLSEPAESIGRPTVEPEYSITLGQLAEQIREFENCRGSLIMERVGDGLVRALYATYISYLPPDRFSYPIPLHGDERGVFVEMLKTHDSGQFSFFTAHPGVTRGGHYHHSKTEKFLVVKGHALFRFRHLITDEIVELAINSEKPEVVDTIPGWAHDITNIGDNEMIVMLWANEIFDRERQDTIAAMVAG